MRARAVCHLNIIGFRAAVAVVKDRSLRGRPYVIAGATGGRSLALDCSPEAIRQGVTPGMALAAAERQIKDLHVLAPDIQAYEAINREIEKAVAYYAPVWENDRAGNLYLDITGTTGLFGPPVDCSSRVLKRVFELTEIKPVTAVACNKLVSKVATRAIRPLGLIQVQEGTEADFLAHQDVRILPGMGPRLLRTADVTGFREIGEIAALSNSEAASLFGKQGIALRDSALGIDNSPVAGFGERRIWKKAEFPEDVIDEGLIKGALAWLAEHGGLEMRREKLGAGAVHLATIYKDGVEANGRETGKRLFVLDKDILAAANRVFEKTAHRRIRISSICLSLENLALLGYQPDLFEMPDEKKENRLQEAIDLIQGRYGAGAVMRCVCLKTASMPFLSIGVSPKGKTPPKALETAASMPPSIQGGKGC